MFKTSFLKLIGGYRLWQTSIILDKNWKNCELRKGDIIVAPKRHYYADPNLFYFSGVTYLMVEDYNMKIGKACIRCFKLDEISSSFIDLGIAVEEKYHLSFPYTFSYDNHLFLTVESALENIVSIYSMGSNVLEWNKINTIKLNDVPNPIDPIVIYFNGLFWLIVSSDEYKNEMYIYYTSDLASLSWNNHPCNPIYIHEEYSRNGGMIVSEEGLYRFAQVQGINNYGKYMNLMKIEELTTKHFREIKISTIKANFSNSICGVHTFSEKRNTIAFDFWKYDFFNFNCK